MGGNKCRISKTKYLKDLWLPILGPKMLDMATRLRSSQGKALLIFGDVYLVKYFNHTFYLKTFFFYPWYKIKVKFLLS